MARPIALRHQLLLALVVPALVTVGVIAYFSDLVARRALDAALGERLTTVAQSAGILVGARVTLLDRGDDETRIKRSAQAKLETLAQATGVDRILFLRIDSGDVLLDSRGELAIGDQYARARFDRHEIEQVALGKSIASVLFEGPDHRPYKTGYAPLMNDEGNVVGCVGVNAAAHYYDAIRELRSTVGAIAAAGFLLLAFAASVSARRVTVHLSDLSRAAKSIGGGDLTAEIPRGGPTESVILSDTMRSMAASLKARDEEMQLMLAGIAHEVRNPLGGIELFGGLLKEDLPEDDPRRKHVEKILRELGVLARVVDDFLHFARKRPLDLRPCDVPDLLRHVVSVAEREAGDKSVELSLSVDPDLSAHIDCGDIGRGVLNIVRNAIQAAPKGGHVWLSARLNGSLLVVEIADDGPGIPPDKRGEVFTPFFTTKQKGTGLGLALVKKTLDAHHGRIRVEDREGGGATFVIELPAEPSSGDSG